VSGRRGCPSSASLHVRRRTAPVIRSARGCRCAPTAECDRACSRHGCCLCRDRRVATATTSGTAAVPATEMNGVAHFDNASGVNSVRRRQRLRRGEIDIPPPLCSYRWFPRPAPVSDEEDLSAEQPPPQTNAWLPRPDGYARRAPRLEAAARQAAPAPDGRDSAEAARVSRGRLAQLPEGGPPAPAC